MTSVRENMGAHDAVREAIHRKSGQERIDVESLLYLAAIVVIVALGFAFAVWLMTKGIRDSEHDWEVKLAAQEQAGEALANSGVHAAH